MRKLQPLTVADLSSADRSFYDSATRGDWPSLLSRRLVYVAGPLFGSGRSSNNVRRALAVAELLRMVGLTPFVPHLFYFWDTVFPHESDYWLSLDREVLGRCKGLVCLPGESPGARCERVWAGQLEIPCFELTEEEVQSALCCCVAPAAGYADVIAGEPKLAWLRELEDRLQ